MNIHRLLNKESFEIDNSKLVLVLIDEWLTTLKPQGKKPIIKKCTIGYNLHSYDDSNNKEYIRVLVPMEITVFESLLVLRDFYNK